MSGPRPIGEILERALRRVEHDRAKPALTTPEASCLRQLVTACECAALAGIEPERLDTFLAIARQAYRERWTPSAGPSVETC